MTELCLSLRRDPLSGVVSLQGVSRAKKITKSKVAGTETWQSNKNSSKCFQCPCMMHGIARFVSEVANMYRAIFETRHEVYSLQILATFQVEVHSHPIYTMYIQEVHWRCRSTHVNE